MKLGNYYYAIIFMNNLTTLRPYTDDEINQFYHQDTKHLNDKYRNAIKLALWQSFGIKMKWWTHYILNGWSHYLTKTAYAYFTEKLKWRYISSKIKELFEKEDWTSLDEYLSKKT